MVYCSGQVGTDPATGEMVEGSVGKRAVSYRINPCMHRCTAID